MLYNGCSLSEAAKIEGEVNLKFPTEHPVVIENFAHIFKEEHHFARQFIHNRLQYYLERLPYGQASEDRLLVDKLMDKHGYPGTAGQRYMPIPNSKDQLS